MDWSKVWKTVKEWIAAAPAFLRSIAKTPTGKYLITAFVMQVVRRTPWMQGIPDEYWKDIIAWTLDGGTAVTLAAGTVYANDRLSDLRRMMRPNRLIFDQNADYAKFINSIVNTETGKVERVTAYELIDGVLYAVAESGLIPATRQSDTLDTVKKAILIQLEEAKK